MTWSETLRAGVAAAGILTAVVAPVLWAAFRWWGSRVWAPVDLASDVETKMASKAELDGLGDRVNRLQERQAATRELAEENGDRLDLVEQEQKHQQERVMEHVIPVLRELSEDLKRLSHGQATLEARVDSGFTSLGRSVDELRERVHRQEDRR